MAKATRAYFGNDTFGRGIELAQSVSGLWFSREYGWNGFQNSWGKWTKCDNVEFRKESTNQYTGEVSSIDDESQIAWGFQVLQQYKTCPKFRLPE